MISCEAPALLASKPRQTQGSKASRPRRSLTWNADSCASNSSRAPAAFPSLLAFRPRHDPGVRGMVLDADNKVFLVKHRYVSGWHLPGGGVEVGETFVEALRRELFEEGRIELSGEPALHGLFLNSHVSRRDHVAIYIVRDFTQDRLPEPEPRDRGLRLLRPRGIAGRHDRRVPGGGLPKSSRRGDYRDMALMGGSAGVRDALAIDRLMEVKCPNIR